MNGGTVNYGLKGGRLFCPEFVRTQEVWALEVHLMLSELEHHANWGV